MITDKGTLIQVEGDKVIQIGTVFQRYGETTPFKRHILVLGETEKSTMNPYLKQETPTSEKDKASRDKRDIIKTLQSVIDTVVNETIDISISRPLDEYDIDVVTCETELDLLLKWSDIIQREDPDFVTGYNIFGFDFAYMLDRMKVYCQCRGKWCGRGCPMKQFMNMGKINSFFAYEHYNKKCKEVKKKISQFGVI